MLKFYLNTDLTFAQLLLHRGRLNLRVEIEELIAKLDKMDGSIQKKKPRLLGANTVSQVVMRFTDASMPLRPFKDDMILGRVIFRYQGETVGFATIDSVSQ